MHAAPHSLDLTRLRVFPLAERKSLTRVEDILIHPDAPARPASPEILSAVQACAADLRRARENNASRMLIYGAHLLRNGVAQLLEWMMKEGWITHLATNGAGTIHDWEYAWLGRSTESVEDNVATGSFGTWDETGRNIHLALLAAGPKGDGYGSALGNFILNDGTSLPSSRELEDQIRHEPAHPLTPARAELLAAIRQFNLPEGPIRVEHRWKHASILAQAARHGIPLTVHPGIGYDIISNHPMFNGAAIGRAATVDFRRFAHTVEHLDNGVVMSVGSAIMGPQVFEKTLSCVHNLRLQEKRPIVAGHTIYVVDLQDGGNWDWSQGEPPKSNPAYYLRFCKSYSRMGGAMRYVQSDNALFIQNLYRTLRDAP